MSSSEEEGLILFPYYALDLDSPAHTHATRWGVVNNAQHLYDEMTQHLVNFVAPTTSERTSHTIVAKDGWEFVGSWGSFPVRLALDGLPVPLVINLGGSRDANEAAFQVRISPKFEIPIARVDVYALATVNGVVSATDAWVLEDTVEIDTDNWRADYVNLTNGVPVVWMRADVWTMSDTVGAKNFVAGLHVREYVGL